MIAQVLHDMDFRHIENFPFHIPSNGNGREVEYGYNFNGISSVPYATGKIVMYSSTGGISFDFSGCAMATFIYHNIRHIAHIFLQGPDNDNDCRDFWNERINNHIYTDVRLFYPASEFLLTLMTNLCIGRGYMRPDHHLTICGYINPDNSRVYSALIDLDNHQVLFEEEHRPHENNNAIIGNVKITTSIRGRTATEYY